MLAGDHHHLIPCPSSENLLIFFTATGAPAGNYNFWKVGNKLSGRNNVLFVNGWSNTWYQDGVKGLGIDLEDTISSISSWCAHNRVRHIFCFGQSMGGHGALLFSALLGCKVLAFGAETVLGLPHSQWERKANKAVELTYPDLAAAFPGGFRGYLLAGERDPIDILCASKVSELPGIEVITMRGVGHGPAGHLNNRDRLLPLIENFICHGTIPKLPEVGNALKQKGFPELFYEGWVLVKEKEWDEACRLLLDAVKKCPSNEEAWFLLGTAFLGTGNFLSSLEAFSTSFVIRNRPCSLIGVAKSLRLLGNFEDAKSAYIRVLRTWKNESEAYYGLGLCELRLGSRNGAINNFRKAHELQPHNKNYISRIEKVLGKKI